MPKKGRHGQRQLQTRPEDSYATPSSDLVDMGCDTPDVVPTSLGHDGALFTFDSDVEPGVDEGQDGAPPAEVSHVIARGGLDEGGQRPSPLGLSPLARPVDTMDRSGRTEERGVGHTRAPVMMLEPNMFESLSRTVRSYVPNPIPIPNAMHSPPSVSRPLSLGSLFTGPSPSSASPASRQLAFSPAQPQAAGRVSSRGSSAHSPELMLDYSPPMYDLRRRSLERRQSGVVAAGTDVPVLELDSGDVRSRRDSVAGSDITRYPGGKAQEDEVVYAAWEVLDGDRYGRPRRLLFLGYSSGLQVWDCTDLSTVNEVLNLTAGWMRVTFAGVLPDPQPRGQDPFAGERPLIGIVQEQDDASAVAVYSLASHRVVHNIDISNVVSFAANDLFIVLCTSTPPALHIISPTTFKMLFTISSAQLVPYAPPLSDKQQQHQPVLQTHLETSQQSLPREPVPVPVFALNHRLLAFASPPSRPDLHSVTSAQPRARRTSSASGNAGAGINIAGLSVSQADIGNAALKVGGSMLSGMKILGGLAVSAARSRIVGAPSLTAQPVPAGVSGSRPQDASGISKMFSRSAPAASSTYGSEPGTPASARRASFGQQSILGDPMMASAAFSAAPVTTQAHRRTEHCVTVLDLAPLQGSTPASPRVVAEFAPTPNQPTAGLTFMKDGTALIVSPRDGQTVKVFKLRPTPKALVSFISSANDKKSDSISNPSVGARRGAKATATPRATEPPALTMQMEEPWHVYDLRRGRTSGVIEHTGSDGEGRWVAVGTRNRTVHVFAVNPYGGRADERSHLEARVRNSLNLQPLSVQVEAIVRLRAAKLGVSEPRPSGPLAFTFLKTNRNSLPASLLPPASSYQTPKSPPLSLPPSPAQRPLSSPSQSPRAERPTNYQDILLFDPLAGTLSLRRCTLERRVREPGTLAVNSAVPVIGGTSISLPSMSPLSRMGSGSSSPAPQQAQRSPSQSGLMQLLEKPADLVARESQVATWHLKRETGWREIRDVVKGENDKQKAMTARLSRTEWISQAELSTCSRSPRLLPRSVYLSHQFSFHALGEDYHALLRRFSFDLPATKIDVRREVAISAYPSGGTETFLQSGSAPRDIRGGGSGGNASFEEPLSSALAADLDYPGTSSAVLPMFPNGTPSSHRASAYAPIRHMAAGLGEGVTEGIGRLRRGVGRTRSARSGANDNTLRGESSGSPAVPLEFEDDDEDFLSVGGRGGDDSAQHDDDGLSLGTGTSAGDRSAGGTAPPTTPPSAHGALPQVEGTGDEAWAGWDTQDAQAIEDAERFDDIVVGYMDEDQHRPPPPLPVKSLSGSKKKKAKK